MLLLFLVSPLRPAERMSSHENALRQQQKIKLNIMKKSYTKKPRRTTRAWEHLNGRCGVCCGATAARIGWKFKKPFHMMSRFEVGGERGTHDEKLRQPRSEAFPVCDLAWWCRARSAYYSPSAKHMKFLLIRAWWWFCLLLLLWRANAKGKRKTFSVGGWEKSFPSDRGGGKRSKWKWGEAHNATAAQKKEWNEGLNMGKKRRVKEAAKKRAEEI